MVGCGKLFNLSKLNFLLCPLQAKVATASRRRRPARARTGARAGSGRPGEPPDGTRPAPVHEHGGTTARHTTRKSPKVRKNSLSLGLQAAPHSDSSFVLYYKITLLLHTLGWGSRDPTARHAHAKAVMFRPLSSVRVMAHAHRGSRMCVHRFHKA